MKTPDEIKRGLECCRDSNDMVCPECPYWQQAGCVDAMMTDMVAYIQQLERERDAFMVEAKGLCGLCKCMYKTYDESPCGECMDGDRWEWRGVEEDDE